MLKIIKVAATDKLLKIYFLKLYQIGFLNYKYFKKDTFDSLIRDKSFDEINSNELIHCFPIVFADFIPEFLFYVSNVEIEFNNVFDFPVLYTSIENLENTKFYEAKYGLFPQTGCDLYNIEGSILKSIHPKSSYINGNESHIEKYRLTVDSNKQILIIDEYVNQYVYKTREIYVIEDVRLVNVIEMNDFSILIDAIKNKVFDIEYASEELRDNKEVVLAAVSINGYYLNLASENLRDNKEIVLAAVMMKGSSLKYASENLKNDKDVVLAAVENFWPALKFASKELQLDKDVQNCVTQYLRDTVLKLNYLEHRDSKFDYDEFSEDYEQQYNNLSNEINNLLRSNNCIHLKDDHDFMIKILIVLYRCNLEFNIVFHLAVRRQTKVNFSLVGVSC